MTVDALGSIDGRTSLALDGSGRLRVAYFDAANGDFNYATCAANCATAANWDTVSVDAPGTIAFHTPWRWTGAGEST